MNLPNRLEFLFITVEALPKASNSGLIYEKQNIIILVYLIAMTSSNISSNIDQNYHLDNIHIS
jgi:hypothetical protein